MSIRYKSSPLKAYPNTKSTNEKTTNSIDRKSLSFCKTKIGIVFPISILVKTILILVFAGRSRRLSVTAFFAFLCTDDAHSLSAMRPKTAFPPKKEGTRGKSRCTSYLKLCLTSPPKKENPIKKNVINQEMFNFATSGGRNRRSKKAFLALSFTSKSPKFQSQRDRDYATLILFVYIHMQPRCMQCAYILQRGAIVSLFVFGEGVWRYLYVRRARQAPRFLRPRSKTSPELGNLQAPKSSRHHGY